MTHRLWLAGLCLFLLCSKATSRADQPARPKSVTVYPVIITPAENIPTEFPLRVAEVVATMLERAGMEKLEIGQVAFTPPKTDKVDELAEAFGEFVRQQPLATDFALFGEILGTPQTGPQKIRTIVVDEQGKLIFAEQAGKAEFADSPITPDDPMSASLFMVHSVREIWNLADPQRAGAPRGKLEAKMRARAGIPSDEELAAVADRLAAARAHFSTSTLTVYPVHLWKDSDASSAIELARLLNEKGICRAQASHQDPQLNLEGDPNQQKLLWDAARAFREFLRKHPPETDYALVADYGLSPNATGDQLANHVNLILCERSGDWVMTDYQNSHHDDFQQVAPKSPSDCNRLTAIRLQARLSD